MSTFSIFLVLIVVVAFLLVVVIMVQNPKGGGLSSSFGGSQQVGGVKKTSDFLDKSTWALATLLLVLILLSNIAIGNTDDVQESKALDLDTTPTTSQPISIPIQNSAPQTDNSEE
jgi:preprotein translocase subunit SecG